MALPLIVLAPLAGAVIAGILALARRAERVAPLLTLAGTLVAGLTAWTHAPGQVVAHWGTTWLSIPPRLTIPLSVHLDAAGWTMVTVVCVVSILVQVYSIGYMAKEPAFARYFAYVALFTTAMLILVVADNLFQLYVGWELVGLCSYLLIGFWWARPSAANAAKKAFIVTRFGDAGFMLGILLLVSAAGSFRFDAAASAFTVIGAGSLKPLLISSETFIWLVPLLLFCGAVGKSAQFPLHVWLPDAMEGPTPVSALIHAATMVAAGVYMVARLIGLFAFGAGQGAAVALNVVLIVGAITALVAATIAVVQVDIKKVMAYSTVSQLGYMMLGLGSGAGAGRDAGMFHLVTHACFKALLFLAAGSVIHAMHHSASPNDMRGMGGLRKRMPATAITCGLGVLALIGLPPFSGFWSKDAILGALGARSGLFGAVEGPGAAGWAASLGLVVGVLVAGITAFYGVRMWLMTFWGEPRSHDAETAHESPALMTVPLWILAAGSVALGWTLHAGGLFSHFLAAGEHVAEEPMNLALVGVATAVALAGAGLAWAVCSRAKDDPVTRMPVPLYRLFDNLWYVDAFWVAVGARGGLAFGRAVAWFDRAVIDGFMRGIGTVTRDVSHVVRRATTGQAQSYALVLVAAAMFLGVLMALQAGGAAPVDVSRVQAAPARGIR